MRRLGCLARIIKTSFVLRTFAAFFLCIFIVFSGLSAVYIRNYLSNFEKQIIQNGILFSGILAHQVRLGMYTSNTDTLPEPIRHILAQDGVMGVSAWTKEGLMVFSFENTGDGLYARRHTDVSVLDNPEFIACVRLGKQRVATNDEHYEFWAPVMIVMKTVFMEPMDQDESSEFGDRSLGAVRVILDKNFFGAQVKRLFVKSFLMGVLALGGGAILAYVQVKDITRPLRRLKREMINFSTREFRMDDIPDRSDEIGKLSRVFQEMAQTLIKREQALTDYRDRLEKKVDERTTELRETNARLNKEIVERVHIQKTLRESEKLYKGVFNSVTDAFFICDLETRFLDANPAAISLYGYGREEFRGMDLGALIHSEANLVSDDLLRIVKDDGIFYSPCSHVTRSGVRLDVEMWVVRYSIDTLIRLLVIVRDISETRALQEQLVKSERLIATGQLAASVAHEINSPLQGISSLLTIIKEGCGDNQMMLQDLDQVKRAFNSIKTIVKKLMDLNRAEENKNAVHIHDVVENTLDLVRSYLKKNRVTVYYYPCEDDPVITGSSQQIGQCLLNLINNAVEAMTGDSGSPAPKAMEPDDFRHAIIIRTEKNGVRNSLTLTISDTGPGIPPDAIGDLFKPFYSKNKQSGLGLGLSICQGIIEDHEGRIMADNTKDGAIFTLTLPLRDESRMNAW